MKPLPQRKDTASVFGMGRSGRALVAHLVAEGVRTYAFDDRDESLLGDLPLWLSSLGVPLFAGTAHEARGQFVFRTPAMRPDHPALCRAALRGAVVMGEAEYFSLLCPAPILAVTGSDGKTTTATMMAGLLSEMGHRVYLGGNIGRSLLPFLSEMTAADFCVLELSSFQTMDMTCPFHTGVVTNLSPNHLNWHKSMAEYTEAKHRLLTLSERRVLRCGLFPEERGLRFSLSGAGDFTLRGDTLCGYGIPLCPKSEVRAAGVHNIENLLAAAAATAPFVSPFAVRRFASRFSGVPHRQEQVGEKEGVRYINSSIDTTPTRTAATLAALGNEGRVLLLLGGRGKGLSSLPLRDALRGREAVCFLFGEMGEEFSHALTGAGVPYYRCDTMREAFFAAVARARAGDAVLLSPAATAYDAFVDFEARGEAFRALVREYTEENKEKE